MSQRNQYLDMVKGVAVLLMVWGHCIQYGYGHAFLTQQAFYEDVLFRAIYSFHMPLFAIVSGYLFSCTLRKRGAKGTLVAKLRSLGIPIITWSVVNYAIKVASKGIIRGRLGILSQYISALSGTFWFLWALLYCSICTLLVRQICKDSVVAFLAVFGLSLVVPDKYNLVYFKFLYPFFAVGYLWEGKRLGIKLKCRLSNSRFLGKSNIWKWGGGYCLLHGSSSCRSFDEKCSFTNRDLPCWERRTLANNYGLTFSGC